MGKLKIPYEGLLDIPEQKVGAFEVKHVIEPAGAKIKISNFRTCMYGGHPVKDVVYNHETRWHELLEDGGVWTSDRPIEQYQQRESILGFRGRVLIGGLGLGVVVQMLTKYKGVTQIDVIEKAPEVMQLVQPYVGDKRVSFYRDDLFDFLKQSAKLERTYNHAFFDIWTSDGEGEFYETVCR